MKKLGKKKLRKNLNLDVLLSNELPECRDGAFQWVLGDDETLPVVETCNF